MNLFYGVLMVKVSVFIGVSLDGFIARLDGNVDWLNEANKKVTPGEDFGFNSFLDSVDCIVMGRKTFEQVITFNEWAYREIKMIVLTTKNIEIPNSLTGVVSTSNLCNEELMNQLIDDSIKHVYVDGGLVIQDFLSSGLVNEITVTIVPILIGKGKSFSNSLTKDLNLTHLKTTIFNFGFVQNKYKVD